MTVDRTIRKSQVITPFGPGGIYDFGDESFVAVDITHWNANGCETVRLPRLERVLGVSCFKEPPIAPDNRPLGAVMPCKSVPFIRFPIWLFCPKCRQMIRWKGRQQEQAATQPSCSRCGPKARLVPMRFIIVCEDGHLGDVDWVSWAHSKSSGGFERCESPSLSFSSKAGKGGGLQSLIVRCQCGSKRDLGKLTKKDAMRQLGGRCAGRHPWQNHENSDPCDKVPQVVQRGSSNAYFPSVVTALDIRTEGEIENPNSNIIKNHASWGTLVGIYESTTDKSIEHPAIQAVLNIIRDGLNANGPEGDLQLTTEDIWTVLIEEYGSDEDENAESLDEAPDQLIQQEWHAFNNPPPAEKSGPFVADIADLALFSQGLPGSEQSTWKEFNRLIDQVVLARRIRVLRVFTGFRRYNASGKLQAPGLGQQMGWLPATEIFGEGIFISLNHKALQEWEMRVPASALESMKRAREASSFEFLPDLTERYVLLHTLSHLLIRQLCFECGYSSSSLSERIYCDENMAGILIYTASSDSEGALGGLVREGEPDRFYSIFKTALHRSSWCSNDPICSELPNQGLRGLNKAACHACALVAETSCDCANTLLDRTLIFGGENVPGYFESLMKSMAG